MLFYDGHGSHFDDREFNILRRHKMQSLILKAGVSVHDHPNDNLPNTKIKNLYGNAIMNWTIHHGGPRLVRDHHFIAHHSSSPTMMDNVSSLLC